LQRQLQPAAWSFLKLGELKNGGKQEIPDWSFPGRPVRQERAARSTQKNGCFVGVWEFEPENARRAPGAWKVIHRLSTKMVKLREFGSFCDNLPQVEALEPSLV
jgi:hypothetical protein